MNLENLFTPAFFSIQVTEGEIQSLYKRFNDLDTDGKGFLTPENIIRIPRFAKSPTCSFIVDQFTPTK